jgi:hypothetical protein
MFPGRFHPSGRYSPHSLGHVDLFPPGADHLPGARGGQNREFERRCAYAALSPQIHHEGTEFGIRQGGMVLDPLDLGFSGQQVFEMPAPSCRILTLSVPARRRPIEDRLYAAAYPRRGLGLLPPDRLQRLHHQRCVNGLDRQGSEMRIDIR